MMSFLPAGRVEDILQTYDRERRVLPPPVRMWEWGWTKSAETWNGRIASAPLTCIWLCLDHTGYHAQGMVAEPPRCHLREFLTGPFLSLIVCVYVCSFCVHVELAHRQA